MIEQIQEAIRTSGRSLNALGKETGVGGDRLSRFMRGERDLTGKALSKLCDALDLEITRRTRDGAKAAKGGSRG